MKLWNLISAMERWFERGIFAETELPSHLEKRERLVLAVSGVVLFTLLVTAKFLTPDARGFGTHRQLGLPPCTFMFLFGTRCPSCGMTTAWASLLDGDIRGSLQANPGGTLLCLLAIVAAPMTLRLAWTGRPSKGSWFLWFLLIGLLIALVLGTTDWFIRNFQN